MKKCLQKLFIISKLTVLSSNSLLFKSTLSKLTFSGSGKTAAFVIPLLVWITGLPESDRSDNFIINIQLIFGF